MFGGRMKRQLRMGQVTDLLVEKATVTLSEMLKTAYPEHDQDSSEVLFFAMWLVFHAFSNAKPNANRKELQALNDAFGQNFAHLAGNIYEGEPNARDQHYLSFSLQAVNALMSHLQQRCLEYNNEYSRDRGVVLVTPYEDMDDFVSTHITNMMESFMKNVFGDQLTNFCFNDSNAEFVRGFNHFFLFTLTEAIGELRDLRI